MHQALTVEVAQPLAALPQVIARLRLRQHPPGTQDVSQGLGTRR